MIFSFIVPLKIACFVLIAKYLVITLFIIYQQYIIRLTTKELMLLNCGVGEDSWEYLGLQEDPTSPSFFFFFNQSILKEINPERSLEDWCWSSYTLATWCTEPTHLKRPWCWERLKAGGKGDERGWAVWMPSPTQWTGVLASSGRWWRTGKPSVLQSMGLQRVRHNWVTELQQNICLSYESTHRNNLVLIQEYSKHNSSHLPSIY